MMHHLELNVSDLERSSAFWGWLLEWLGHAPHMQWERGRSWMVDGIELAFVQTAPRHLAAPFHRGQTGLNHLAFRARSREQVDQLTSALRERGVEVLYAAQHPFAGGPDYYAVFFEDPDRIKVELVAP
ncbi:MAG: hypothetical protein JWM25_1538 [Thermoleophilia bacterium]|nr:hypothetical protein [Thermoleophilia bacterium]MCZ4496953.1 hypothetical protein [Thermoleophilia bacterium]